MPVYLLHGFRWPRPLVRIHVILQNLEDVAAEWLVAPNTTESLLENFTELYPQLMEHLPNLRFVEQYDPNDFGPNAGSQPYAYIADVCHEIKLGIDVDEVRGKGVSNEQWAALLELRDKLAHEEKVGWFIVVCGDEERLAPEVEEEEEEEESALPQIPVSIGPPLVSMPTAANGYTPRMESYTNGGAVQQHAHSNGHGDNTHQYDVAHRPRTAGSSFTSKSSATTRKDYSSPEMSRKSFGSPEANRKDIRGPDAPPRGIKKLLGALSRRKSRSSMKDMSSPASTHSQFGAPPVPPLPRQAV
ncbi:hypothetical protein BDZ85DRAFT_93303 [Elsinoe ampelina]|uniref:Uncharacterized protein n=1 Tax=Elsinoe ampelina TaxID=302913 RepID=A0A6A6FYA2_9PEZI|nr:hypothetical protein BDZ85DRAFT_93303 [Elsinoe ampelina]